MNQLTNAVGDITLYCLGGCGINVGFPLEDCRGESEPGMATISNVYIDTSRSNLRPGIPEDKVYIIKADDETDGSGKERGWLAPVIMKYTKDILQKHPAGYMPIILSSLSGGSGAVIAASIANEFMQQGKPFIMIGVGVSDSGTEIANTKDAIRTFEGLVRTNKKSLAVAYFENSPTKPASAVDEEISELISAISLIFSRQNEGMDTRDLHNFLNVEARTPHSVQVVGIEAYAGKLVKEDHATTITVASAVVNKDMRGIDFILPYTTYGVMPTDTSESMTSKDQVHLVTKSYPFNEIQKRLNGHLAEIEKAAKASTAQSELLDGDDELTGGFLAL